MEKGWLIGAIFLFLIYCATLYVPVIFRFLAKIAKYFIILIIPYKVYFGRNTILSKTPFTYPYARAKLSSSIFVTLAFIAINFYIDRDYYSIFVDIYVIAGIILITGCANYAYNQLSTSFVFHDMDNLACYRFSKFVTQSLIMNFLAFVAFAVFFSFSIELSSFILDFFGLEQQSKDIIRVSNGLGSMPFILNMLFMNIAFGFSIEAVRQKQKRRLKIKAL